MSVVVVVMGVSASGKTTLAQTMAQRLGWAFQEGDDLHPPVNIEKMREGHELSDNDRAPWLDAISRWIRTRLGRAENGVITCSALKRAYRDKLRDDRERVRFVFLRADAHLLAERLAKRSGHFMPASLLDSQLRTLEEPDADEKALTVDAGQSLDENCRAVLTWLGDASADASGPRKP